jgi:hypothetical protein
MANKRHGHEPTGRCAEAEDCAAVAVHRLSQERVDELAEEIWTASGAGRRNRRWRVRVIISALGSGLLVGLTAGDGLGRCQTARPRRPRTIPIRSAAAHLPSGCAGPHRATLAPRKGGRPHPARMRLPAGQMKDGRAPARPDRRTNSPPSDEARCARWGHDRIAREPEARGHRSDRLRLDVVRGVGRAIWRWKLRDPNQGPPERLAAGRVRGPHGHRRAGGDGAAWPAPGPVLAPWPAGPHSIAGP